MIQQKPRKIKNCEIAEGKPVDQGLRILASIIARHHTAGLCNRPGADHDIESNDISNEMNNE